MKKKNVQQPKASLWKGVWGGKGTSVPRAAAGVCDGCVCGWVRECVGVWVIRGIGVCCVCVCVSECVCAMCVCVSVSVCV